MAIVSTQQLLYMYMSLFPKKSNSALLFLGSKVTKTSLHENVMQQNRVHIPYCVNPFHEMQLVNKATVALHTKPYRPEVLTRSHIDADILGVLFSSNQRVHVIESQKWVVSSLSHIHAFSQRKVEGKAHCIV